MHDVIDSLLEMNGCVALQLMYNELLHVLWQGLESVSMDVSIVGVTDVMLPSAGV